jgi:hypothetical protein
MHRQSSAIQTRASRCFRSLSPTPGDLAFARCRATGTRREGWSLEVSSPCFVICYLCLFYFILFFLLSFWFRLTLGSENMLWYLLSGVVSFLSFMGAFLFCFFEYGGGVEVGEEKWRRVGGEYSYFNQLHGIALHCVAFLYHPVLTANIYLPYHIQIPT